MTDYYWPKQRKLLRAPDIGFNAEVYRHFNDPDISDKRKAIRDLCLIGNKDSRGTAESKMRYFREQVQKIHLKPEIYGLPTTAFQAERKFKPQVELSFLEDSDFVAGTTPNDDQHKYRRKCARITFRIMGEEADTISNAKLTAIANKIKATFMIGKGFVWHKGRLMCSYADWDKGYQLQLACKDKTEGKRVVEAVLGVQGHTPDWKRFTTNENEESAARYPASPGKKSILGESEPQPQERPVVEVRFRYAVAHIHGRRKPVALCDRSRQLINPLVN